MNLTEENLLPWVTRRVWKLSSCVRGRNLHVGQVLKFLKPIKPTLNINIQKIKCCYVKDSGVMLRLVIIWLLYNPTRDNSLIISTRTYDTMWFRMNYS